MRRAAGVTIQPPQILRLSRRKTRILRPHHIWNLIYNARSNRCHDPTSPNTAPVTQKDSHTSSSSHMKPHLQCAEQQVSRSNLTKYCACHAKFHCEISDKIFENRWNVISNAGTIREWSENDPRMIRPWKRKPQPASHVRLLFELPRSIFYCKIQRFEPNLTFKHLPSAAPATKSNTWPSPNTAPTTKSNTWTSPNTAPTTKSIHQVLHLPRKVTRVVHPRDIWKLIYNARSNQCHPPNSPNIAPATQNDHLTCGRNLRKTGETSFPMLGRSENDPSMIRPWSDYANEVRLLFEVPRSIFYCKIQRFEPNLIFKHSPSAAPATKSNTWPSPNTAPTTKSNTHSSSSWHMNPYLQCAEQSMSPSKLTKYCACHAKWPLNVWQKFAENRWNVISNAGTIREWSENDPSMIREWSDHDPTMIRPWKRKPQPASQVRLLFEVPRSIFYCKIQRFDPNLTFKYSPSAAPATKSNTWPSPNTAPTTKSNTWPSPNTAPATKVTLDLHGILPLPQK